MGIKELNKYFVKKCTKKAIYKISLTDLYDKVVVIDVSIFIYRFLGEPDGLIPNLYSMITILLSYKIIPIFIFDGKTPLEKRPLLDRRRIEKREAAEKYNELLANIDVSVITESKKEIEELRKKSLRLTYADLDNTKLLFDAFGISYMRAPGEADALCAYLVKKGFAWACMSEDMDLFLYGCNRVLRHFNLYDHTVILYDTILILEELGIGEKDFLHAMVLMGTDYNLPYENMTLEGVLYEAQMKSNEINLYDHLIIGNNNSIDNNMNENEKEVLYKICEIFHIDNMEFDFSALSFKCPLVNWKKVREFMENWGFVFL